MSIGRNNSKTPRHHLHGFDGPPRSGVGLETTHRIYLSSVQKLSVDSNISNISNTNMSNLAFLVVIMKEYELKTDLFIIFRKNYLQKHLSANLSPIYFNLFCSIYTKVISTER